VSLSFSTAKLSSSTVCPDGAFSLPWLETWLVVWKTSPQSGNAHIVCTCGHTVKSLCTINGRWKKGGKKPAPWPLKRAVNYDLIALGWKAVEFRTGWVWAQPQFPPWGGRCDGVRGQGSVDCQSYFLGSRRDCEDWQGMGVPRVLQHSQKEKYKLRSLCFNFNF
jgi:hypothetical protein